MMIERHETDILILGTGGAGLFAALHAKQANPDLDITLAVKGLVGKCGCTRMVQGGYNVALNPGDSIERHFMDTIAGGKWLPRQDLAWRLCETAVERIKNWKMKLGVFLIVTLMAPCIKKLLRGKVLIAPPINRTWRESRSSTA